MNHRSRCVYYKFCVTFLGVADLDLGNVTLATALADNGRIQNHCSHLSCLKCAMK